MTISRTIESFTAKDPAGNDYTDVIDAAYRLIEAQIAEVLDDDDETVEAIENEENVWPIFKRWVELGNGERTVEHSESADGWLLGTLDDDGHPVVDFCYGQALGGVLSQLGLTIDITYYDLTPEQKPFDLEGAQRARAERPGLTPYDTGEMLKPTTWGSESLTDHLDRYGKVDFDDEEGFTALTVFAHPSSIHPQRLVLNIDATDLYDLEIVVNDNPLRTIVQKGSN